MSSSYVASNSILMNLPDDIGVEHGSLVYNPKEWSCQPEVRVGEQYFAIAGWFVYEGRRNCLDSLSLALIKSGIQVLNDIEAGSFIIYWWNGVEGTVVNDYMGLSTHYIDLKSEGLRVAPSVQCLYQPLVHTINPMLKSILDKKEHLFGDHTLYNGIERLSPGSGYSESDKEEYLSLAKEDALPLDELVCQVGRLVDRWPVKHRLLPISGGLDSRFILASNHFEFGFTYGPETSPERKIASHFQSEFQQYHSYNYIDTPKLDIEDALLREVAFGVHKKITPSLFSNYDYVSKQFPQADFFFDGYIGDALQRGTYIQLKGALGELLRVFPFLYRFKLSAKFLMCRRYKELDVDEFAFLFADFTDKTQHLKLNAYQKVTFYEALYGRGARNIVFGGNVLVSQIFTSVSPFTSKSVFNSLLHHDFSEAVSYKTIKQLWSKVNRKYRKVPVESGYSLMTPRLVIPYIQLLFRLMLHFIPSRANYSVTLKRKGSKSYNES
ncbi:hypothetical protein [Shewanella sediminis]|uniref:hypothetical protein n=1 Tax=Shewanella sediminis TaxID=271097 RepID=UPI001231AA0A|nr:hypothetical protein [Shewanella sediminis]